MLAEARTLDHNRSLIQRRNRKDSILYKFRPMYSSPVIAFIACEDTVADYRVTVAVQNPAAIAVSTATIGLKKIKRAIITKIMP